MKAVALITAVRKYRAPLVWLTALVVLYFMEPGGPSLCLFKAVGFSHCPGCGIGSSIHYALHGQLASSFEAHWLGIPAMAFLLLNIVKAFFQSYKSQIQKDEPATAYDVTGPAAR